MPGFRTKPPDQNNVKFDGKSAFSGIALVPLPATDGKRAGTGNDGSEILPEKQS
jgi:hypothetical protein